MEGVDRTSTILWAVAEGKSSSLTEVSRRANLNEATTLRYLTALREHAFVERDDLTGQYRLGMALFRLGNLASASASIRDIAAPTLHSLMERFGETVNLAMRHQDDLIIVDVVEGRHMLQRGVSIGDSDIWHASALGKAYLAAIPTDEARKLLKVAGTPGLTHNTLTSISAVIKELALIRERGYAVDDEEVEQGLRCVGAAIFDSEARPSYVVSISFPVYRLPQKLIDVVGRELLNAALEITQRSGGKPQRVAEAS